MSNNSADRIIKMVRGQIGNVGSFNRGVFSPFKTMPVDSALSSEQEVQRRLVYDEASVYIVLDTLVDL